MMFETTLIRNKLPNLGTNYRTSVKGIGIPAIMNFGSIDEALGSAAVNKVSNNNERKARGCDQLVDLTFINILSLVLMISREEK